MSFYGEQPKLNELNFTFDAYYPSRTALLDALNNNTIPTQVIIGSYVLVSYYVSNVTTSQVQPIDGIKITTPTTGISSAKYVKGGPARFDPENGSFNSGTLEATVVTNATYKANLRTDLENYKNSYHNTVWQYVAANNTKTFIMIAELNSLAPQLNIEYQKSANYVADNSSVRDRATYKIIDDYTSQVSTTGSDIQKLLTFLYNNNEPYSILEKKTNNVDPKEKYIKYNSPQLNLAQSSELGYKIDMPTIPYFIFNLHKDNPIDSYDTINVAYDEYADAYVLNMFLGHLDDYLAKVALNFEINEARFHGANHNGLWEHSDDVNTAYWTDTYWENLNR